MDTKTYSFIAVIISLVAMTVAIAAPGSPSEPDTLSISGTAEVTTSPELLEAVLAIETESTNVQEAQEQNRNRSAAVMTALEDAGIPEDRIETTDYRIQTIRDRSEDGTVQPTRYRVTNQVTVEIHDLNAAGSTLDAAVGAGANRVDSMTFGVTDERRQELQDEAMREAASVTEDKASSLADSLGARLGSPVSLSESNYEIHRFESAYDGGTGGGTTAPSTRITPGDVSVSARVEAVYRIR